MMISFFWLRWAKRESNKAGGAMILGPGKESTHPRLISGTWWLGKVRSLPQPVGFTLFPSFPPLCD